MRDALTPERIAELRTKREVCWSKDHPELLALLDAADEAARLNTPGQLVVRRGDTVTTYPFAQRVPCDDGLEFRCRTYDVQEPHREWYEERIAELEAENETLRTVLTKHQWADSDLRGRPQCPSCCGVAEDEGHYSDCEIAAAIRGTPKGEQQS